MTNLTPPSMLSSMRSMNRANMRSRARVQEEVSVDVPGGASAKRWVDRLPISLPCRVSAPSATDQEILLAAKVEAKQAVTIVFAYDADVNLKDRFIITLDNGTSIIAYPVGFAPRDVKIMHKMVCEVRS